MPHISDEENRFYGLDTWPDGDVTHQLDGKVGPDPLAGVG
jgi:hypothetical protein